MGGTRDIQNAFNAGELSPLMLGRTDLATYSAGLRTCENWLLLKPGGIERRPGTLFVADAFRQDVAPRLMRFHVSQADSFAIEWSEGFFRIMKESAVLILATYQFDSIAGVDIGTEEFIQLNHGYFDGAGPFRVSAVGAGTLPAGLLAGQDYYIDLPRTELITAGNAATDVLTCANTYSSDMGPFRLKTNGVLPTGLNSVTDYFVRNVTPAQFQLSLTAGGAAINFTTNGTGTHSLIPSSVYKRSRFRLRSLPSGGSIIPMTAVGTGFFNLTPQLAIAAQFAHPYLFDELNEIDHAQSGDVMYLAHQFLPPQKLTRHSNQQWSCEEVQFYDGPYFLDQETFPGVADETITISPSALSGPGITLTASKALFVGSDHGRLLRYAANGTPLDWGFVRITGVSPISFVDTDFNSFIATIAEWNAAADQIDNSVAHLMEDGEPIMFDVTDGGVTAGQQYYAHRISANSLSVHNNQSDAIADLNRVNLLATGVNHLVIGGYLQKTAHGVVGRVGPVTLSSTGTLPAGLSGTTNYWLTAFDANHLSLALSPGGVEISPSALNGTGTHQINGSTVPSTTAIADVLETLVTGGASLVWRMGAWSDALEIGYPKAVVFHEQRLVFANTVAEPQTMFFSQSGDFENFATDTEDAITGDHAISAADALVLAMGSEEASRILWMTPMRTLVIGCLDGPWVLQAPVSEAISAIDLPVTRRQARVGIGDVKPVPISVALVFTSHSPGFVQAAAFDVDQDSIVPTDLMVLASHLADHGAITRLAQSGPPLDTTWMVRADGQLLALTFDPVQEITAWSRFLFGASLAGAAVVESCCTVSDPTDGDQLWIAMRRTINGATRRTIEVMAPRFRTTTVQEAAHFLDSGVDRTFGSPQTVVTGLGHLEGETVGVLGDGAVQPSKVVSGGQVTLSTAATRVHVGLAYTSVAELMPAEVPVRFGFQIAMLLKKVVRAMLRIHRSLGLKVGKDRNSLGIIDLRSLYADEMDQPVPLRTGVVEIPVAAAWERDGNFAFGSSDPLPCQVLATMERLEWSDH